VRVARWAVEYRYQFHSDVVVDLIGFRRHGHSEIDDPTTTQPVRYRALPSCAAVGIVRRRLQTTPHRARGDRSEFEAALKRARNIRKNPGSAASLLLGCISGRRLRPSMEVDTAVRGRVKAVGELMVRAPAAFSIHPKVRSCWISGADDEAAIPWILARGVVGLRLPATARDAGALERPGQPRGTFNQRHATLFDTETEAAYTPLANIAIHQPRSKFTTRPLEAAVMGFEYGYSRDYPETLTLWEAQFGDFATGRRFYRSVHRAGEISGDCSRAGPAVTARLRGPGAEHSSARLERFLQLAAATTSRFASHHRGTVLPHVAPASIAALA